jgi:phospholipase/carboxylesterase
VILADLGSVRVVSWGVLAGDIAERRLVGLDSDKGVFTLSGRLVWPVPVRTDWPLITLLHGSADPVIPAQMAEATEAWWRALDAAPDLLLFDGLAHSFHSQVLSALGDQLA